MANSITEIFSGDISDANLWKGYVQGVAENKGEPLELVIPVGRHEIKEVSISVVHDQMGNFSTAAQSEELKIPIDKLILNHKFMPTSKEDGKNTMVFLKSETGNSVTIKFNHFSPDFYTSGKVAWR